jgi:hypothetical protein
VLLLVLLRRADSSVPEQAPPRATAPANTSRPLEVKSVGADESGAILLRVRVVPEHPAEP